MKVTIYQNPVIIKVLSHDPLGSRDKKCELKSWGFTSQFVNEILLWNQKHSKKKYLCTLILHSWKRPQFFL